LETFLRLAGLALGRLPSPYQPACPSLALESTRGIPLGQLPSPEPPRALGEGISLQKLAQALPLRQLVETGPCLRKAGSKEKKGLIP
jgi:hypothetical protein